MVLLDEYAFEDTFPAEEPGRCETCNRTLVGRSHFCGKCRLGMCGGCEHDGIETQCEVCDGYFHAQCLPVCGCGCETRYCERCQPMHREDQLEQENTYFVEQIQKEREAALERAYAGRVLAPLAGEDEMEQARR